MKRYLACGFIFAYLTVLSWGLLAHTFNMGDRSNTYMYFVVWDMFCGWQAYDYTHHVIAQGVDGNYYQVEPAPWGPIRPFSDLNRHVYDYRGNFTDKMVKNVLDKTEHPPISRVFLIEEFWSKKYNIPDYLYHYSYGRPKDKKTYFMVRSIMDDEGMYLTRNKSFENVMMANQFMENPRMKQLMHMNKPYYQVSTSSAETNTSNISEDNRPSRLSGIIGIGGNSGH